MPAPDPAGPDPAVHAPRVRGRGTPLQPGNRFEVGDNGVVHLEVLPEHLEELHRETPEGRQVPTRVLRDRSRTVVNRVDSPDMPFHWTLNPYRGCEHGCVYCYARPTHETLGLSCGLDFETTIIAKPDAPALLRRRLLKPSWRGEPIAMAGVTDAFQPLERRLRITRGCLEVMAEFRQPVGIVTKNRLVTRDLDLLEVLARHDAVHVYLSITTLDASLAAQLEPRTSTPRDRLAAIRALADAGVPVGVMVAPVIPGLNDHEIPAILEAAADAGARASGHLLLRLPHQVETLFLDWLARAQPLRAGRIERAIRSTRDGRLSDSTFGRRMRGTGALAEHIGRSFEVFARRFGLDGGRLPLSSAAFRRPGGQGELFGGADQTEGMAGMGG